MYVVNDNGILTVFDAEDRQGNLQGARRRIRQHFLGVPWAADGKIYLLSEDGHTFVLEAGDTYLELAKNSLDEMSLASPALAANTMFMRTQTRLYESASRPTASALR